MEIPVLCLYLFATILGGAAFAADGGEKLKGAGPFSRQTDWNCYAAQESMRPALSSRPLTSITRSLHPTRKPHAGE
jgi:hypothetical protein